MNLNRIKFFAKEITIFILLITILPLITACIITPAMDALGYGEIAKFNEVASLSVWTIILTYLITPLTAKLPNFGKINRWWRFFIIYAMLA